MRLLTRKKTLLLLGLVLMIAGTGGAYYSIGTARAHIIDLKVRVSGEDISVDDALAASSRAHQWYRFNHRLCEWAAIKAYDEVAQSEPPQSTHYLEQSEAWCDIALELNPYSGSLHRLKARFLQQRDAIEAAKYWKQYLDWVYWNEANHLVMVELYAAAGELELAEDALNPIEGRRYYKEAEQILYSAWRREMDSQLPSGG